MNYKKEIFIFAKKLFPLNRSLISNGSKETLLLIKKKIGSLKINKFKTGSKVFDWIIPQEWNVKDAYFANLKTNKKFAEYKKNNLHLLGYSENINKVVSKKTLNEHIFTHKNPRWIPYRTSYYQKNWGFCMSKNEQKRIRGNKFKVFIDSKKTQGNLLVGEYFKKGRLKSEILFSTYVCHPSMANNEVSGPVVATALAHYIKKNYKLSKFSYRFLFLPETIGSIAYLSKNYKKMKKVFIAGYNLSCVGDERAFSIIKSKSKESLSNISLQSILQKKKNFFIYDHVNAASDERQYNWPGIDLEVAGFCRSKYKTFPEYHTSADNFKVVTANGLYDSFNTLKILVDCYEKYFYPFSKILCEPFLSKYNLYPNLSGKNLEKKYILRKNLLRYCDGKNNIFDIALKINSSIEELINELDILKLNNLVTFK
jgi:aminopeptidase-like protein